MANKTDSTEIREIFSQNLRFYRIKANMSQEKLGEEAKLSDKYISDLERQLYHKTFEYKCSK